jgi:hypothetical protein
MRPLARVVAVITAAVVTPASAGFELTIDGSDSFNAPLIELENTRTDDVALERFGMTIGDMAYNFDRITDPDDTDKALSKVDIEQGDFPDDVNRVNKFLLKFDPALTQKQSISWIVDIDEDDQNTNENFRSVLFNNGAEKDNAVATAYFGDGTELSLELPNGQTGLDSYNYSAVMPLPAALPLFAGGLAGVAFVARRRRAGREG